MKSNKYKKDYNDENDLDEDYEAPKKWYDGIAMDPKTFPTVTEQVLIDMKEEARICLDSEVINYNNKNSRNNSDFQWMKTVMHKGTISDRVAAHTVAIQNQPIYNLETLRNLVGMVKVGKKKECIAVIETLTELFLSDLLRKNIKLKPFHQRPISQLNELSSGNAITRRKLLSAWYFEDQLKEVYTSFVLALNLAAQDTVESNKEKAITAMFKLLAGNSEQEQNLLKYIVNKVGDPSAKVASKAIYCLNQLLIQHSNMQNVVLSELEKLIFRPNVSTKAQYYSLCFLSQFYLSHEAGDVARKLIEVYFSFFKACVKKGDVDSRMMSALLMGINRAYPYAKLEFEKISEHIDTMYRLVHIANFNISLHALTLLYQVSDYGANIADRFYSALYKKLLDPKLITTTHQAMLLSLIYKALLKDKETNRVKVFIKRLLQISFFTPPCFSAGILYLVSQLLHKKENLQSLVLKQAVVNSAVLDEDDDEKYHDVVEKTGEETSEPIELNESKDEEEEDDIKPDVELLESSLTGGQSWYHCGNKVKKEIKNATKYNPMNRNPSYGGGEYCAYTELINLKNHFHPTVSLYATSILTGESIKYNGDPLKDFTLIRFLDRFVFKNPKKIDEKSGVNSVFAQRKFYKPKGIKMVAVNSANYFKENATNIPVDELFLHTYIQRKYQYKELKSEEDEDESDVESVQSEDFEDMLDKMAGIKNMEEDIDFMTEIGDNLKNKDKKNKKKRGEDEEDNGSDEEEDEEEEDLDDEEDFDDDEEDFEDDDNSLDLEDEDKELIDDLGDEDDDEEDLEFDDDLEEEPKDVMKKFKQKRKGKKDDLHSLFASADEFATLLEDEGSSKVKPGSSNAFANKDNADFKQVAWEDKRNHWIKGFNSVVGKGGKGKGKFAKKRPGEQFTKKSKKFKK